MTTDPSRRWFLKAAALAGCAPALAARAGAQPETEFKPPTLPRFHDPFFEVRHLKPDLAGQPEFPWDDSQRLKVLVGEGGNTLLALGLDSAMIVDSKNCPFGGVVRTDVTAVNPDWPTPPEVLLINTHHHADHTGGNHAFTRDSTVLAHPRAITRIRGQLERYRNAATQFIRNASADDNPRKERFAAYVKLIADEMTEWSETTFAPTRALTGNRETVKVGEGGPKNGAIEAEVIHFAQGHTDNDVVVKFPRYNVLHTGDLCFHECFPYVDRAGGANTWHWQWVLEKVIELCDDRTIVVPGHGDITDVKGLRKQIRFFTTVREKIQAWVKEGKTRDEVMKMEIEEFAGYAKPEIRPITFGGMFDEVTNAPIGEKK